MKKLLVVLLSLGLIVAFSMTASAADVKVQRAALLCGRRLYENNPTLGPMRRSYSHAYFYARTRIQTGLPGRRRPDLHDPVRRPGETVGPDGLAADASDDYGEQTGKSPAVTETPGSRRTIEIEHAYCDLQDRRRPVRDRLSGARRVGHRLAAATPSSVTGSFEACPWADFDDCRRLREVFTRPTSRG